MRLAIDCRLIGETGIGTFIDNVLGNIVQHTGNVYVLIGNAGKLERYRALDNCVLVDCALRSFTPAELLRFPVGEVNKCDAFYTPNFNIPMGIKVPIYSTIHDILFFETENFGSFIHRLALKWYVKRALRISSKVFTVSQFSKERIKAYFNSSADIEVVNNGISANLRKYRAENEYDGKKEGIVFLGSIKKHKGLHVLLEAYSKLRGEKGRECPSLTVIGHVDFRTKDEEILNIIQNSRDSVNFLGAVDDRTLYDVLSRSAVLVSPSFYEGFGIPPLEAMYLGTPAIISDIPVYKEVYRDLPVAYFKTGDSDDLYAKLRQFVGHRLSICDRIDEMYSYADTAGKILGGMAPLLSPLNGEDTNARKG